MQSGLGLTALAKMILPSEGICRIVGMILLPEEGLYHSSLCLALNGAQGCNLRPPYLVKTDVYLYV